MIQLRELIKPNQLEKMRRELSGVVEPIREKTQKIVRTRDDLDKIKFGDKVNLLDFGGAVLIEDATALAIEYHIPHMTIELGRIEFAKRVEDGIITDNLLYSKNGLFSSGRLQLLLSVDRRYNHYNNVLSSFENKIEGEKK